MSARKCAQTVMASPGPLNWRNEVSRHSQVTELVMNYSPPCESIKTSQGSVPCHLPYHPDNSLHPFQPRPTRRPALQGAALPFKGADCAAGLAALIFFAS